MTTFALAAGVLALIGATAQAAQIGNGSNLNGSNLNGSNLNGSNLNGSNLNGTTSGRAFLGTHILALIAPDGAPITLD
jgi:uncharacterized protein YjbI with pentapeptide repeats